MCSAASPDPEKDVLRAAYLESYNEHQAAWHAELMREEPDARILCELHMKLSEFELALMVLGVQL